MKMLERLRKKAIEVCKQHNHKMGQFNRKYRHWWYSDCKVCDETVTIRDDEPRLGLEISGIPVVQFCNKTNKSPDF